MKSCENCFIKYSPQWRTIDKTIYCNECAIYFKRKNIHKDINVLCANILVSMKKS